MLIERENSIMLLFFPVEYYEILKSNDFVKEKTHCATHVSSSID